MQVDSDRAAERLGSYFLQIFVHLLRSCGPEHDGAVVSAAVAAMTPCLGRYEATPGERIPGWVNYVRKAIMENTDAGSSVPPALPGMLLTHPNLGLRLVPGHHNLHSTVSVHGSAIAAGISLPAPELFVTSDVPR